MQGVINNMRFFYGSLLVLYSNLAISTPTPPCLSAFKQTQLETVATHIHNGYALTATQIQNLTPNPNVIAQQHNLLLCSLFARNKPAFEALLQLGADANMPVQRGYAVIHFASEIEDTYFLIQALKYQANPNLYNIRQSWKPTPLFFAVAANLAENVKLLLQHGANIDEQDVMGETIVVSAANFNNFKLAYELIHLGANLEIRNKQQLSIIDILRMTEIPREAAMYKWKQKIMDEFDRKQENPFKPHQSDN